MAVAITTGIGASGTLTDDSRDGVIYLTGAVIKVGLRVQPVLSTVGAGLQARPSASGNQMMLNSRSTAARVISADVSMEAREASSLKSPRIRDARSKVDVLTKYGDSRTSLLTADNGTLTLSRASRVEPVFAMAMLSYQ